MQFYFFTEFGRDQIEHNQINNQFLHKRRLKRGQQSFVFDCAYFGKDPSSYMKINGPLDTSFRHILHTKLFSPSKKNRYKIYKCISTYLDASQNCPYHWYFQEVIIVLAPRLVLRLRFCSIVFFREFFFLIWNIDLVDLPQSN